MVHDLVDAISLPAFLVGVDGQIAAANAGARAIFGQNIDQLHYVTALRQPPLLEAIEQASRDTKAGHATYSASSARGDATYDAAISPVGDAGMLLVCLEDRTATHQADQMRRDFVANVTHELRTPLTALLGFIETLRGAAKSDEAARDRFLGIMENEANRMNRLVNDLLSLSRVEAEERKRPTTKVSLESVVRGVINNLSPLADERDIRLNASGLEHTQIVQGDKDQLAQVATNLIENAIKYSGQGTSVDITLSHDENHPQIRGAALILSVQDQGDGIDAHHIPRLTERFYRIDSHRSRELGGTGLGLAIVKHIVNRHRGRLKIESNRGVGSRFSVVLPTVDGMADG